MSATPEPGTISWQDLTVADADGVRDFYEAVAGWTPEPLSMGAYSDFVMNAADGTPVAGICHARAGNGLAATGRFVASSVRNGGNSPSPSW